MITDQWQNCYDGGWQGLIVPEAFSHPAKFSRGLIQRIYLHAKEMKWVKPGDWVLDPFGGVALGGLDAISMGLNWIGIELEEKFVKLGEQNIELWNRQLKGWPNLGTARIIQGDSRKIVAELWFQGFQDVIEREQSSMQGSCKPVKCDCLNGHSRQSGDCSLIVSSPPFMDQEPSHAQKDSPSSQRLWNTQTRGRRFFKSELGHTPGNLANMKEGDIDLVVSSPPYVDSMNSEKSGINWSKVHREDGSIRDMSKEPGQKYRIGAGAEMRYGQSPGQLGSMQAFYSRSNNNLGNSSGDTFWSASKEIISQCYDLLKPNGMSIWVCKDYVKAGKRVPFSDRWLALCESVGFKLVCRHRAMLVKEHGTQTTIHGDEKIIMERKSFFRRLAESKGSPKIDWEDVLCLVKKIA